MAKSKTLNVVVIEPGKLPEKREIENTLESFKTLVDGYIEMLPIGPGIPYVFIINEEGKLSENPKANFFIPGDCVFGTAVLVKTKGDDFCDVKPGEIDKMLEACSKLERATGNENAQNYLNFKIITW